MKKIKWEIFFGDSSSEDALCLFAAGLITFKEFAEHCYYSDWRKDAIKSLKQRGYLKARRAAQRALRLRGFTSYIEDYKYFNKL